MLYRLTHNSTPPNLWAATKLWNSNVPRCSVQSSVLLIGCSSEVVLLYVSSLCPLLRCALVGIDGIRHINAPRRSLTLPLSPSAGSDGMWLASFFYNTQDHFRSVHRWVLTAYGLPVSSITHRISSAQSIGGYWQHTACQSLLCIQNSPAQSVGRCWRHPARQDLLITHGISSAQSIGGYYWRHPARQCLPCMWHSPARSIGRRKLLALLAQSVALCPVATWSHYALPCSSRLLSPSLSLWLCLLFSFLLSRTFHTLLLSCSVLAAPFLYPQPPSRLALPLLHGVHQSLCWFRRLKLLDRWYPPHTRLDTQMLLRYINNNYI